MKIAGRAVVATISVVAALGAAEEAVRVLDGWPMWGRLALAEHAVDEATAAAPARPDRRHVAAVPLAPGVSPDWYEQDPPTAPRIPMTEEVAARAARYPGNPYEAFTEWNREYARSMVCAGTSVWGLGVLDEAYVFRATEPGIYPTYRNPRSVSPPGWFVTNRFGWRGPDLSLNKDGRTIRIAFVGASTTVAPYYLPFSYPEFVGHWLNVWLEARHPGVRAEVINAARTGIDSFSIAAIVRQEVAPLEPDLVVYYEGANSFSPLDLLDEPPALRGHTPKYTFRPPSVAEQFSAVARRATGLFARFSATDDGREPAKAHFAVRWPSGVNEEHPDPDTPVPPMSLGAAVRNLDEIHASVEASGGELAVESFVWMVPGAHDALDLRRHLALYQYLNQTYWPIGYDQLRRLTDFQNRLFRAYAEKRHVQYLPVAEALPRDADLFGDAIHLGEPGLRLQGWIVFQQLVPWIEARLRDRRLPRAMRAPRTVHPAFQADTRELVSIKALKETCH